MTLDFTAWDASERGTPLVQPDDKTIANARRQMELRRQRLDDDAMFAEADARMGVKAK